jgi:hypothetical protein
MFSNLGILSVFHFKLRNGKINKKQYFESDFFIFMKNFNSMKKFVLLFYMFFLISQFLFSQRINWKEDIEDLRINLPRKHINFFSVKSQSEFNTGLDGLSAQLPELSDFETAVKLQQFIAGFGDSHTGISWHQFINQAQILP